MMVLSTVGAAEARAACDAVEADARRREFAVVVAVGDVFGELILPARMDHAVASSVRIAANKAYSAARERKPTRAIGEASRRAGSGFDIGFYGDDRYTGWPGGLPVIRNNFVVGAVGVSGATDEVDEELAKIGVEAIGRLIKSHG